MCAGAQPVSLTGSPVGGTFSGSGITGNTFNPVTAGVGTHSIKYGYADNHGCSDTATNSVTVQALPTVNAGSDASVNYGSSASLNGSVSGPGTYNHNWSPANMVTSATSLSTQTVSLTTSQIFTLTAVETTTGCSDSDNVTITVTGGPLTLNVSTSASQICAGDSVTLNAVAGGGTGSYSYSWTFGGTQFSTSGSPMIAPTASGYYKASVSDGSNSLSDSVYITVNPLPTVLFGGLQPVCEGSQAFALYGGNPAGGTYSGVGVSNGQFNPVTAGTGSHQITYTYTDGNGCSNSATQLMTVNTNPTVTLSSFTPVCNTTPAFTLTGGSPADGNYNGAGIINNTFTASSAGIGTHVITYVYTDANSCTDSASANITVNSAPVANAGSDQTITTGSTATLSGSATGGSGNYSYSWSPASKVVNAGMQSTSTVALSYSTQFELMVFDTQTACKDSDEVLISVTGGALSGTLTTSSAIICAGDSVQLTMIASGGSGNYTYSWTSSPAGFTSTVYNPYFIPTASLTWFYVTVNDGSNQFTDSIPVQTVAIPQVNLGNDTLVCGGGLITLDAGSGFSSYQWSDGSTGQTLTVNGAMLTPGNHSYSVTVTNNGTCSGYDTIMISKDSYPYVNLGPDDSLCSNGFKLIDAGYGFSSYLWSTGDTTQIITVQGQNLGTGIHNIWVKVKSTYGCQGIDTLGLKVYVCNSVSEIAGDQEINIYPNPTDGRLTVEITSAKAENIDIEVINLQGKLVYKTRKHFTAPQSGETIDLSTLPAGIYLIRLKGNDLLRIERIVVK
jgi:hypothetical protein